MEAVSDKVSASQSALKKYVGIERYNLGECGTEDETHFECL